MCHVTLIHAPLRTMGLGMELNLKDFISKILHMRIYTRKVAFMKIHFVQKNIL